MNRHLRRTHRQNRKLGLERLETREVLAGNVHAFVSGGNLHLVGDSQGNQILVEQTAPRNFTITSSDGTTTINGQAGPLSFGGVRKNVILAMKGGDDVVDFDGTSQLITIRGQLIADMGSGNDQLLMENVHLRGMTINMGSGADLLNFGSDGATDGISSSKMNTIDMGSGADDARIANSHFDRLLLIMNTGNDTTTIQNTSVHRRSTVNGGPGNDTLNRQNNTGRIKYLSFETVNNSVTSAAPIPPIAANDTATVTRGQAVTINVAANDTATTGQTINNGSITITQAPAHGTAVANANGTVTYTNNGDEAASDTFKYTIKDSAGTTSNAATVTITVNAPLQAVNDAGSVTEDATPNTATGNVLTNDTGGTGTKTVSAVNGSAASVGTDVPGTHGTFHINADGTFTYTLNNNDAAVNALNNGQTLTDSMGYTAKAGSETSNGTLSITINGHTDLVAVADSGSVTEDAAVNTSTGNVLTNDTGGNGTKTVSAVNGNAASVGTTVNGTHGTFKINSDGSFTYTLNNADAAVNALNDGQTLQDSINYTTTDGIATSSSTLTITINGTTDLQAANDSASITEDATPNTTSGNALTNDTGGAGTKTVTAVNGSAGNVGTNVPGSASIGGTFHINADGTFTYTLDNTNATVNNLNNGDTLTDTATYTVTAGAATSTATITVTIHGHTELVANADTGNVTEDTALTASGNVLTNDTGGTGTKTVTAVGGNASDVGTDVLGQHGTFHINSDGTFTYALNNNDSAVNNLNDGETLTDSIGYTASDTVATSNSTLTITIHGRTDLAAANDSASITEDAVPDTVNGDVATNDTHATGTTLTVTEVKGSAGNVGTGVTGDNGFGTFTINANGTFSYQLDNNNATINALNDGQTQTDTITYQVSDGTQTSTATVTVTIHGRTDLSAANDSTNITEDASPGTVNGDVSTNDTHATGTTLTVTQVNGSAGNVGTPLAGANNFGTFTINSNGTFSYQLNNNNQDVNSLSDGETLTDTITYTISDGTQTSTATVTVTIHGTTDLHAVADTNDVTEDSGTPSTTSGNVLTNDTGGPSAKTVTAVGGNTNAVGTDVPGQFGTFHINSDGTYTYTLDDANTTVNNLNNGDTLTDSINYTVSSGLSSDTATLTITIHGHTDP